MMDTNHLRQHFNALSDEALREIRRDDLAPDGVLALDAELSERGHVSIVQPTSATDEVPKTPNRSTPWWSNLLQVYAVVAPVISWIGLPRGQSSWAWTTFFVLVALVGWVTALAFAVAIRRRFTMNFPAGIAAIVVFIIAHRLAVGTSALLVAKLTS